MGVSVTCLINQINIHFTKLLVRINFATAANFEKLVVAAVADRFLVKSHCMSFSKPTNLIYVIKH
jgi:hypothetical protein